MEQKVLKQNVLNGPNKLGIYLHIPFCVKKCDYCDFLSAPADEDTKKAYFEALFTEINSYKNTMEDYVVSTIFIGGGTPSSVDAEYIKEALRLIYQVFTIKKEELEVTIELNPGMLTKDKLMAYQSVGINRLSFGLQSVNNEELRLLGRIHTYEQFYENYRLARELGFTNINIDLMSALPKQTPDSWEHTLKTVISLQPEHISAYSLIIEEGTKFFERFQPSSKDYLDLPDEDTDRLIYHRTKVILEEADYHRYEISNYAKPNYESKHNCSYWIGTDYLGIGLGAASLLKGTRFRNIDNLDQYIELCNTYKKDCLSMITKQYDEELLEDNTLNLYTIRQELDVLSEQQQMEEFMFLGLRLCQGVSKEEFRHRFGKPIEDIYEKVLKELVNKKLILIERDQIRLTEYGIDISNSVLSEFLID